MTDEISNGERLESPEHGLNALSEDIHMTALSKRWWSPNRTFGDIIALIHSEASEALEEYRDLRPANEIYYTSANKEVEHRGFDPGDDWKPQGIPTEFADIIIRVLDACAWYGIDIEQAMRIKMAYNRRRPSGNKAI